MKDVTSTSFGLVIAYLLPGLMALYALSYFSIPVHALFLTFLKAESNVGLFLLVDAVCLLLGRWDEVIISWLFLLGILIAAAVMYLLYSFATLWARRRTTISNCKPPIARASVSASTWAPRQPSRCAARPSTSSLQNNEVRVGGYATDPHLLLIRGTIPPSARALWPCRSRRTA